MGRREIYKHDTEHCRLAKRDLVGKCDPLDSGICVRTIKTRQGCESVTYM